MLSVPSDSELCGHFDLNGRLRSNRNFSLLVNTNWGGLYLVSSSVTVLVIGNIRNWIVSYMMTWKLFVPHRDDSRNMMDDSERPGDRRQESS